jgi:hypothetical protein
MTFKELMAHDREFLKQWKADPASVTMPDGESFSRCPKRAWPVIEKIIARKEDALVVSHNFTIADHPLQGTEYQPERIPQGVRRHGIQDDYPGRHGNLRNRPLEQSEPFRGRRGILGEA